MWRGIHNDEVSSEEIKVDREDKDDNPKEESEKDVISSDENEIDCEDKDDASKEMRCCGRDSVQR